MADGWEDISATKGGWEDIPSGTDGWEDDPSNPAPEPNVYGKSPSFGDVVTNLGGSNDAPAPEKKTGYSVAGIDLDPVAVEAMKTAWDERTQDMGLSPETRKMLGADGPIEALRPITNLPANIADLAVRGMEGLGAAGASAVAGLTAGVGEDFGVEDRDRMAGSAAELSDIAALVAGGHGPSPTAEATAARAKALQGAFDAGASVEDLLAADPTLPRAQVETAVAYRDKGGKGAGFVPDEAAQARALQNEADTFTLKKNIDNAENPLAQEAAAFKPKAEPTPDDLFPNPEAQKAKDAALEERLQQDADTFQNKDKVPEVEQEWEDLSKESPKAIDPEYARQLDDHAKEIDTLVKDTTKDWTNSPSVTTVRTIDDLPDGLREKVMAESGTDAKGVIDDSGNVHIIAENIEHPADASGVIFHEALGHHGLVQRFGQRLDKLFDSFYNTNERFRAETDDWLASNPSAYSDLEAGTRRRLAAEEVLAERSELGPLDAKMWDVLKNNVKSFARQAKINLKYSDREINTILGMAHDAVINGKGSVADNGFRLSRGDGKGFRPKASMTAATMETRNPVDDLSSFLRDKNDNVKSGPVNDAELKRMADDLGLTASKYVKTRSLGEDKVAAKIKAAHQILTNQMDELAGLGERARTDGMTPSLFADIQERLRTVEAVYAKFDEDTSELGRALRALKQVDQSRKSAQSAVRFMKDAEASGSPLGNPQSVMEFLDHLNRSSNELSPAEQAAMVRDAGKPGWRDQVASALNIPRSLMSSVDLSAPLRQGLFLINRKEWWKAWAPMLKSAVSEKAYNGMMSEIRSRPTYPLMQKSGLSVTDINSPLSNREEAFMSNVTKHIPVVRGSERAYSAFLNKLRADTFDSLVKLSEDAKIPLTEKLPPYANGAARPIRPTKQLRGIARFVNSATGRGDFKSLGGAGPLINATFFSPRLIKSRFDLVNPMFYADLPPQVRKEAIKSLLSLGAIGATIEGLFALNGAEVETDYRSSDAGKIKIGNTRYDVGGGFNQEVTLGTRLATNETKSLSGNVRELGKGFGTPDAYDLVAKYARNKLAPVPSLMVDLRTGKNAIGEEVDPKEAVIQRFVPLFLSDYSKLVEEQGLAKGTAMAAPGLFGVGTQTFDASKPKEK